MNPNPVRPVTASSHMPDVHVICLARIHTRIMTRKSVGRRERQGGWLAPVSDSDPFLHGVTASPVAVTSADLIWCFTGLLRIAVVVTRSTSDPAARGGFDALRSMSSACSTGGFGGTKECFHTKGMDARMEWKSVQNKAYASSALASW